jgi:hypothetical protein
MGRDGTSRSRWALDGSPASSDGAAQRGSHFGPARLHVPTIQKRFNRFSASQFAEQSDSRVSPPDVRACVLRGCRGRKGVDSRTPWIVRCRKPIEEDAPAWPDSCEGARFGVATMMQSPRLRRARGVRAAMGGCVLLLVGCGGSAFDAGSGSGSSGGAAAGGGNAGNSAIGGSLGLGGGAGAPAATGGAAVGDGGAPGTGGAPSTCSHDSDCVMCAYTKAPENSSQCYCATCAITPLTKSQCDANQAAWQESCANVILACPAIACIAPQSVACVNGQCAVAN